VRPTYPEPELVIEAWVRLPEAVRTAIVAMIHAASKVGA
jgi:hypothetical protein